MDIDYKQIGCFIVERPKSDYITAIIIEYV